MATRIRPSPPRWPAAALILTLVLAGVSGCGDPGSLPGVAEPVPFVDDPPAVLKPRRGRGPKVQVEPEKYDPEKSALIPR